MNDRVPYFAYVASLLAAIVLQLFELPYALAVLRPLWVPMVLTYWAMTIPQPTGLVAAWITGLLLDVLLGTVLGQHALGLTLLVFAILQVRGILALYPVWQEALALTPLWAAYVVLMFWIDGATGHPADALLQWMPVATTVVVWPLLMAALDTVRRRAQRDPAEL